MAIGNSSSFALFEGHQKSRMMASLCARNEVRRLIPEAKEKQSSVVLFCYHQPRIRHDASHQKLCSGVVDEEYCRELQCAPVPHNMRPQVGVMCRSRLRFLIGRGIEGLVLPIVETPFWHRTFSADRAPRPRLPSIVREDRA